ncbi:MAG: transcriptional repressor [Candidatus Caldarchaeum sp.]
MQLKEVSKSERKKVLREYLAKKQLKATRQREIIFEEFFDHTEDHVSVEELYERVKARNSRIGFATIYRTLKLFKECGLAFERHFGDGKTRYEPINFSGEHHDHFICEDCGKIICFNNPKIHELISEIAKNKNFAISNYKLELYGHCESSCEERERGSQSSS